MDILCYTVIGVEVELVITGPVAFVGTRHHFLY